MHGRASNASANVNNGSSKSLFLSTAKNQKERITSGGKGMTTCIQMKPILSSTTTPKRFCHSHRI